jgi:hypothetical protein
MCSFKEFVFFRTQRCHLLVRMWLFRLGTKNWEVGASYWGGKMYPCLEFKDLFLTHFPSWRRKRLVISQFCVCVWSLFTLWCNLLTFIKLAWTFLLHSLKITFRTRLFVRLELHKHRKLSPKVKYMYRFSKHMLRLLM